MPWLADLVESNDSSLDVLPVQCLCEFLLHDAPSDISSSSTAEDTSPVERHKKQVRSITKWLLVLFIVSQLISSKVTVVQGHCVQNVSANDNNLQN